MKKQEFQDLFGRVIEEAIAELESKLDTTLSRSLEIELHGAGYSKRLIEFCCFC